MISKVKADDNLDNTQALVWNRILSRAIDEDNTKAVVFLLGSLNKKDLSFFDCQFFQHNLYLALSQSKVAIVCLLIKYISTLGCLYSLGWIYQQNNNASYLSHLSNSKLANLDVRLSDHTFSNNQLDIKQYTHSSNFNYLFESMILNQIRKSLYLPKEDTIISLDMILSQCSPKMSIDLIERFNINNQDLYLGCALKSINTFDVNCFWFFFNKIKDPPSMFTEAFFSSASRTKNIDLTRSILNKIPHRPKDRSFESAFVGAMENKDIPMLNFLCDNLDICKWLDTYFLPKHVNYMNLSHLKCSSLGKSRGLCTQSKITDYLLSHPNLCDECFLDIVDKFNINTNLLVSSNSRHLKIVLLSNLGSFIEQAQSKGKSKI